MEPRPRVTLGIDPFMLRTALYRHLSRSGLFDVSLVGPGEPDAHARLGEADAVIVSTPVDLPGALVVVVSSETIEVVRGGPSQVLPYGGLEWLVSFLSDELAARAG